MRVRWVTLLLCLTMLTLAGCYQQAGETYQPAQNAVSTQVESPTLEQLPTVDSGVVVTETTPLVPDASTGGTATLPPITVISPPTRTPDVVEVNTTESTELAPADASLTTTPQFITPGISLGLITPDATVTPVPGTSDGATPSGLITPTALVANGGDGCTYVVQPGDNLFRIAVNNNTTVAEMKSANNLAGENPVLQVGQELVIPGCNEEQVSAPEPTSVSVTAVPAPVGGGEQYTIQPGDTLFRIAQRYGITVQAIVDANDLSNPNNLQVGQVITIPPSGG